MKHKIEYKCRIIVFERVLSSRNGTNYFGSQIKQQLKKQAQQQAASGHHMPPKRPTKPATKPVVTEDEELEEKIEL